MEQKPGGERTMATSYSFSVSSDNLAVSYILRLFARSLFAFATVVIVPGTLLAGPVILGGDDLTDHGSRNAAGQNLEGWLYIEKAISNLNSSVSKPGTTVDVAAIGSADPGATFPAGNAGAAIK